MGLDTTQYLIETYLGGEVVEGNGASQNAPGIPAGTTSIWICARGGDVYITINGVAGPLISPMHAPDGSTRYYGPFNNIHSLGIYADDDVYAHISYQG